MQPIGIHSVPRSGSTWLGSIFDSHPNVIHKHQPLFSYALKDFLNSTSSKNDIISFFEKLVVTKDDFMDQVQAKAKGLIPKFEKDVSIALVYKEVRYHHILENLLAQHNSVKIIGLIRNPLSTIHSWWKAPREFRADLGWDISEEWLHATKKNAGKPEEFNGFLKWKEVALLFENLAISYPDRFRIVDYHDLLSHTRITVQKIFQFCGLEYGTQTDDFIQISTNKMDDDAYGVYKIKENDESWKESLPQYIADYIKKDIKNTPLAKYLHQ